jgi:hypothetical protein
VTVEVLTTASIKMAVFWGVSPCSPMEVYRRFGDTCCPRVEGDYRAAQRDNPADSHHVESRRLVGRFVCRNMQL